MRTNRVNLDNISVCIFTIYRRSRVFIEPNTQIEIYVEKYCRFNYILLRLSKNIINGIFFHAFLHSSERYLPSIMNFFTPPFSSIHFSLSIFFYFIPCFYFISFALKLITCNTYSIKIWSNRWTIKVKIVLLKLIRFHSKQF